MVSKTRRCIYLTYARLLIVLPFLSRQSDMNNERLPPSYNYEENDSYEHVANGNQYPHTQRPMRTDYVAPSGRRYTPEEFQRRIRQTMYDQQ